VSEEEAVYFMALDKAEENIVAASGGIDSAERYVILRRLEARLERGDSFTTSELAADLGLDRRTVRKYLDILQTAEEFRLALEQVGWRWNVFK
jgi:response regulator of citrate/malate metabolism